MSGFLVRLCWRIDAAVNRLTVWTGRLTVWTGRLAASVTRWDMRRRGQP